MTGPVSSTSFGYGAGGRLATVTDTAAGTFSFEYDNVSGRLDRLERPNGLITDFGFDDAGRLLRASTTNGPTMVERAEYEYGPDGTVRRYTNLDGDHNFTYDDAGRLATAEHPASSGFAAEIYTYDAVGNRTSWQGNPASVVGYDEPDRLTSDALFFYDYDNEGNLIARTARDGGNRTTFTWNALHQLTEIDHGDGTATTFRFDGLGRRISIDHAGVVNQFVHDGAIVRAVYDGDGNLLSEPVTVPGREDTLAVVGPDGASSYPLTDGAGTTTAVADAFGQVTARFRYDAFGNPSPSNAPAGPGSSYAGLAADPGGLLFARTRVYDPTVGRFLSEDPVTANSAYPYAGNNPLAFTDPTGSSIFLEYVANVADSVDAAFAFVDALGVLLGVAQAKNLCDARKLAGTAITGLGAGGLLASFGALGTAGRVAELLTSTARTGSAIGFGFALAFGLPAVALTEGTNSIAFIAATGMIFAGLPASLYRSGVGVPSGKAVLASGLTFAAGLILRQLPSECSK